jgi:hypothetical protein
VLPPDCLHIRLQLRAEGTVVVQPRDTTINLKAGREEELLLQQVLTLLALVFLGQIDLLGYALYYIGGDNSMLILTGSTIFD